MKDINFDNPITVNLDILKSLPLDPKGKGVRLWSNFGACGCLKGNFLASCMAEEPEDLRTMPQLVLWEYYSQHLGNAWSTYNMTNSSNPGFAVKHPKLYKLLNGLEFELRRTEIINREKVYKTELLPRLIRELRMLDGKEVLLIEEANTTPDASTEYSTASIGDSQDRTGGTEAGGSEVSGTAPELAVS